jgi:2-amino-4-hydroxy-6-hydroxymethyldihydropteridine diphosphokinase
MTVAYLATGSNLGERGTQLQRAARSLERRGVRILRAGRVHETEPFGVEDQPAFLNQVLEVEWNGSAHDLLLAAKDVERELGRTPTFRWGPREIDVDILLFGEEKIAEPDLTIPHPGLRQRRYLQEQLAELRPDLSGSILMG